MRRPKRRTAHDLDMKRACNRFFCRFLVAAILLTGAGRGLAQPPGDSTAQQLRQELESLRIELVRQHREHSARSEALRQELARNQQESQALLDQLLEAQTQLGQVRSGEELARCRAEQEALRAQLAERKATITYMEQIHERQLADARQENEALLAQLLAAQSQLRQQESLQQERKVLLEQIRTLELQLSRLKNHEARQAPTQSDF